MAMVMIMWMGMWMCCGNKTNQMPSHLIMARDLDVSREANDDNRMSLIISWLYFFPIVSFNIEMVSRMKIYVLKVMSDNDDDRRWDNW